MNEKAKLLTQGLRLEYITLLWNVVGVAITAYAAIQARSIALGGFGLDSVIEIGASLVVVWELTNTKENVRAKALRIIGVSFYAIATYILGQVIFSLMKGIHPSVSGLGIVWTAITLLVMLALAYGKRVTGTKLGNPVLITEGKVTLVDAYLAGSILVGLVLNAVFNLWWADLLAALVVVFYGFKEGRGAIQESRLH